jgi:hypothetical protein
MSGFGPSKKLETRPRRRVRAGALGLLLLLAPVPLPAQEARPQTVAEILDRLEAAYDTRDAAAAASLYLWADEESRTLETENLQTIFGAEQVELSLQRPARVPAEVRKVVVSGQLFRASEPRARVDQLRFVLEWKEGWAITGREDLGNIDGLVHLSLDPRGYKADDVTLKLEDFELRFRTGTFFTSPESLGPTLLLFVGQGEVTVSPRPAAEREQLRRFSGEPELRDQVRTAFIRLHPADLHRMLEPARFEPDPEAAKQWAVAQRVYREHSQRYFILDAPLPGAPWWLLPGVGDASVTFDTRRNGELTFTTSSSEAEDLSLFDRAKRRQICLYPSGGREPRYTEDAARVYDFLHLDLQARFEPTRRFLSGEARLKLRLLQSSTTIRLRLDDDFKVESVTSGDLRHLFFRVRGQDSLMVSLGPLSSGQEEITLIVRYSGTHEPAPVEHEVLQVGTVVETQDESVHIEKVLVYTNRTAWYPRPPLDDHATARLRFDLPLGLSAVTGGQRTSARVEGQRTLVEYQQDRPGKYVTVAVARFYEAGERNQGDLRLRGFGTTRTKDEMPALLQRGARILDFFTREFGPCPYPDLNLVLVEAETPGGHAPPGMVLLLRRPPLMRRTLRDDPASFPDEPDFFLAHELAHQWFGHGVTGANYRERWLSEGFAQYAAALWARERGGETAFRNVLERFARWAFRYDDEGPIHLGYRIGHLDGDAQAYRAIVYDKAAYVLHMLRGVIGEAAFRRGLAAYQEEHQYGKAGTDDLREALEAASGQELAAYFRSWVFGTGLPHLSYRSRVEGATTGYQVALDVKAVGLPAPVRAQVTLTPDRGDVVAQTVELAPGSTHVRIDSAVRPKRVELNADRGLLARVDGK